MFLTFALAAHAAQGQPSQPYPVFDLHLATGGSALAIVADAYEALYLRARAVMIRWCRTASHRLLFRRSNPPALSAHSKRRRHGLRYTTS